MIALKQIPGSKMRRADTRIHHQRLTGQGGHCVFFTLDTVRWDENVVPAAVHVGMPGHTLTAEDFGAYSHL